MNLEFETTESATGKKMFLKIPNTFDERFLGQYFKRYKLNPQDNVFQHQFLDKCNELLKQPKDLKLLNKVHRMCMFNYKIAKISKKLSEKEKLKN